jgi:hypothetical protein
MFGKVRLIGYRHRECLVRLGELGTGIENVW